MKIGHWILGVWVLAVVAVSAAVAGAKTVGVTGQAGQAGQAEQADRRSSIDPLSFFERLVERYRDLESYHDTTHVVQVTNRPGVASERVETEVHCDIEAGELQVSTPLSQLRERLGLKAPMRSSEETERLHASYLLWLVPHMTLKYTEHPLEDFRDGVAEGFTATDAGPASIDDKPMVHLELTSGEGLSEDHAARFHLFVNPKSMLIERIEGEQRLGDGGRYETTLEITPEVEEPDKTEPEHDEPEIPWPVKPNGPVIGPTG